ncbi:GOLPH3/VPS74 family protein [Rhizomonospora bruguierae]|uniref:GOLPH3/VPS74 family protein n=1 Tax=Rhizomonospora bruguierae TaxID=1581705 RepID=UPI0020BFDBBC|nr:GPP34 family phosphoprotein [Micromonospora sp. NBRC 107566]
MEMTLADELLLISYDDAGVPQAATLPLDYGLAGALLIDLALAGRVDVVDGRVVVTNPAPTGVPLLDSALERVGGEGRKRTPQDCVRLLSRGLRERALDRLVEANILRRDQDRVLWIIPRTIYPSTTGTEPAAETAARHRLRTALDRGTADARTAALAALVRAVGLEKTIAPDRPVRQTRERLGELAQGNWAAEAVRRAVQEMQAAIIAVGAATAATAAAVTAT